MVPYRYRRMESVTDKEGGFTFSVKAEGGGVYVEIYDGNMGDVVVESKMTKAKAQAFAALLLGAAAK